MKTIIAIFAAIVASSAMADQYRIKFQTTVDIIEDGSVTGSKRLKPGTMIEIVEKPEADAKTPAAGATKTAKGRAGRLTPSNISPVMFKNERQPKTTLRARIELGSSFYGRFEDKKTSYWNITIKACTDDWNYADTFYGYLSKSSPIAKRLLPAIQDGKEHRALVMLTPIKDDTFDDFVTIDDFELNPED